MAQKKQRNLGPLQPQPYKLASAQDLNIIMKGLDRKMTDYHAMDKLDESTLLQHEEMKKVMECERMIKEKSI